MELASLFFAVPASVQGITADNAYSSHSLIVSWQKAVGVAERYDILLLSENGILLSNTSEAATTKQHKFEDLTPGKKYKIQILTVSGGLFSKEAQTEGRTGNSHNLLFRTTPPCLLFLKNCRAKGMKQHWEMIYISWHSRDIHRDLPLPPVGLFAQLSPHHTPIQILHQNWLYSFLIFAVINCHKLCSFKQHRFIIL